MGNVVRILSLIICALIALEGCRGHNNNRKPLIQRNQKGGPGEAGNSQWGNEAKGSPSCGCLRLNVLANLVQNLDAELLSFHYANLDFVDVKSGPVPNRPAEPRTEPKEGKPQKNCMPNRARVTFSPIGGELDQVKLNYFFGRNGGLRGDLAQTFPAKEIKAVGRHADLITVKEQNGCETVTLMTAEGQNLREQKFEVVDGTPSGIRLRSGDEYRSYTLLPNDQVMITIVSRVANIDRCGSTALPATFHRLDSYILSKAANKDRFQINANLGQLYRYIYDTPELSGRTPKPPATPKNAPQPPAAPGNGDGRTLNLSGATLQYLTFKFANRKDGDFTCSTPVLPRN